MEVIVSFLEKLNLETYLGGLTSNTIDGLGFIIILMSLTGFSATLVLIVGGYIERSKKMVLTAILLVTISSVSYTTTYLQPRTTDVIVLKEYEKNTKDLKLNSTTVKGTEHFFMVLTNKGTTYNFSTDNVLKMKSCNDYRFQLVTRKDNFIIYGNKVTAKATNPVIEVSCF